PWRFDDFDRAIARITTYEVLVAALVHGDTASRREPGRPDRVRKADSRKALKRAVEAAHGDVCVDCGRGRAHGVRMFALDHVDNDGGGRGRSVRTDAQRARVLAHMEEHGTPPSSLALRCTPCHTKRHRREALDRHAEQAAGMPDVQSPALTGQAEGTS